jgi:hypothetical protein
MLQAAKENQNEKQARRQGATADFLKEETSPVG